VWKGYFVPTVTGNHKFRGLSYHNFAVYLSESVYGSTVSFTGATPIAFSNTRQASSNWANYYQVDVPTAESGYIALEAGKKYYMEIYHINYWGAGRFSLSVEMPNTDLTNRYQTYEVQTVSIVPTVDPEIIEYTSRGVNGGKIYIQVYDLNPSTLEVILDQTVSVNWNATANEFCDALNQFFWIYGYYKTTCSLTLKNAEGVTTDPSLADEYLWSVSINNFRPESAKNHNFIIRYSQPGG
jgi:hypothetical protein